MKKYLVFVLAVLFIGALATGVLAGKTGGAGKSKVGHLYLYEKHVESIGASWDIVDGGAWGKMKYNLSGPEFEFVFNGHGLEPDTDYCLIYYPDPWPGNGLICLGTGTTNANGGVHIMGSVDTGDLPAEGDGNHPDGAKIWLVPCQYVDCDGHVMTGWPTEPWQAPEKWLFEYDLITFDAD